MSFYLVFLTDYKTTRPSQFINEKKYNSKDQRLEFSCFKKVFLFVNRPLADLLTFPRSDEKVKTEDNIVSEKTHNHGLVSKTHCVSLV